VRRYYPTNPMRCPVSLDSDKLGSVCQVHNHRLSAVAGSPPLTDFAIMLCEQREGRIRFGLLILTSLLRQQIAHELFTAV
jgi:hypothetical protein